jgi:TonB family protein
VSISGGNPKSSSGVSGLGGLNAAPTPKIAVPSARAMINKPQPQTADDDPIRTSPPDFSALAPGAKPEAIFATKRVYTMNVNMPNLNSATGSWILNFSELRTNPDAPHITSTDLAGPVPLRKVDPKYPPALISERVAGEVILYAIIRRDGSIDAIQLVRGVDEQLDANSITALSQWKFRPASKQGDPIEVEAIVHIPFRLPSQE